MTVASVAQEWAALDPDDRDLVLDFFSEEQAKALLYDWETWARPDQLPPPGDWFLWWIRAGRGWGKTRSGAEFIRREVDSGRARHVALVNDTAADVRDVMVEGESGLLSVYPPAERPVYEPSKRRLTWANGAIATCYAAEAPEMLRGPNHDLAWADEPAKWKNLQKRDAQNGTAWDNLMMGLRKGRRPRAVVTTTPRPVPIIRALLARGDVAITGGSSFENRDNLADDWFARVVEPLLPTRLGRQEIFAELLDDTPGALWAFATLESCRHVGPPPDLVRVVVAVDPSGGDGEGNAEQGIVVAGKGIDGRGYVLADRSCKLTPDGWGRRAVQAYLDFQADAILAEANFGGAMVEATIRAAAQAMAREGHATRSVPIRMVSASRGKRLRAEPVAALYEQRRIAHCGVFPELEAQMTGWTPEMPSPDRLDAMAWAITDLLLGGAGPTIVPSPLAGYRG